MSPNVDETKLSFGKRANKPLMEKKRRERINGCLQQLKTLVMESLHQEGASQTKLEKADILEMTVKYLEELKSRGQLKASPTANRRTTAYQQGYQASVSDVTSYLWNSDIGPASRTGIIQNMAKCLKNISGSSTESVLNTETVETDQNNNDFVDGTNFSNGHCSPQKIRMEMLSNVPLTPIDGIQPANIKTEVTSRAAPNASLPLQIATSAVMTSQIQHPMTQSTPVVVSLQQQPSVLTTIPATNNAIQTGLPNGLQIVRAAQVGENVILLSNNLDQGQYRILQVQKHGMQMENQQGQSVVNMDQTESVKENIPTQTLPSISTFSKGAKRLQSFDQVASDITDQSTGSTYTVLQPVKRQCLDYYGHYDQDENVWRPWSKSAM